MGVKEILGRFGFSRVFRKRKVMVDFILYWLDYFGGGLVVWVFCCVKGKGVF